MSYFTSSKYERMMTRIPKPLAEKKAPPISPCHPCYGCKRYGERCMRPCYRDVRNGASLEVLVCSL